MIPYPKIPQFRQLIREIRSRHDFQGEDADGDAIYKNTTPYPTITFIGTVKLHGTNAAVVFYKDGSCKFQSRGRELALDNDHFGFMNSMHKLLLSWMQDQFQYNESLAVYGERRGGGVNQSTGGSRTFVIFAIKADGVWLDIPDNYGDNDAGIYNTFQFKTYEVDIDFNKPELSQNKLIEYTMEVEANCPVRAYFGQQGVGEGVVFSAKGDKDLIFKSKGQKHSVSKVKVLNAIDVEMMSNVQEFVDSVVSENRLQQGLTYLEENNAAVEIASTGTFLRWIVGDVISEELDTITKNGLDEKLVNREITKKARQRFLGKV